MSNKLSVVVPIYNSEKFLSQCINSILDQTYSDIEVILVDDGSTDTSGEICELYSKIDERVIVIHKKNEGLIKARLSGAEKACGAFITFVDADDWIVPDTYEQMMRRLGDCDIVMAGVYRYFSVEDIREELPVLEEGIYDRKAVEDFIIPYMLWSGRKNVWELDPSLCTKIFKKDQLINSLRKASSLDIYFGEDTAVIFPLMLNIDSIAVTHECYYYHRQRGRGEVPSYFLDDKFFEKLLSLYKFLKSTFKSSRYWQILCPQLERFYMYAVQLKHHNSLDYQEFMVDIFPFWDIKKGDDVILYGAGELGNRFYRQNEQYQFCNIVLWTDKNYQRLYSENKRIVSPNLISTVTFDYIIIAIRSIGVAREIVKTLTEMRVPTEKIIWDGTLMRKVPK